MEIFIIVTMTQWFIHLFPLNVLFNGVVMNCLFLLHIYYCSIRAMHRCQSLLKSFIYSHVDQSPHISSSLFLSAKLHILSCTCLYSMLISTFELCQGWNLFGYMTCIRHNSQNYCYLYHNVNSCFLTFLCIFSMLLVCVSQVAKMVTDLHNVMHFMK